MVSRFTRAVNQNHRGAAEPRSFVEGLEFTTTKRSIQKLCEERLGGAWRGVLGGGESSVVLVFWCCFEGCLGVPCYLGKGRVFLGHVAESMSKRGSVS